MSKTFRKNVEIEPETTNNKPATITKEEFMNEKNLTHTTKLIEITDWTEENVNNLLYVPSLCLTCPNLKFDKKGNASCKACPNLYVYGDEINFCSDYPIIEKMFRQALFSKGIRGNWETEIQIFNEIAQESRWYKFEELLKRKINEAIEEAL